MEAATEQTGAVDVATAKAPLKSGIVEVSLTRDTSVGGGVSPAVYPNNYR